MRESQRRISMHLPNAHDSNATVLLPVPALPMIFLPMDGCSGRRLLLQKGPKGQGSGPAARILGQVQEGIRCLRTMDRLLQHDRRPSRSGERRFVTGRQRRIELPLPLWPEAVKAAAGRTRATAAVRNINREGSPRSNGYRTVLGFGDPPTKRDCK